MAGTALSQGSSVTLTVVATDTLLIDSGASGSAIVEAVTGVPGAANSQKIVNHPGGQATYGPFGAGTVKLSAIGGPLTYMQGTAQLVDEGRSAYSVTDANGNVTGISVGGTLLSNQAQWVLGFHRQTFESRIAYIMSGATPFVPLLKTSDPDGGFVPDGATSAALIAALTAAAASTSQKYVFLTQNINITADVAIPTGVTLFCGTYVITSTGNFGINLGKGSKIVGGKFVNSASNNITFGISQTTMPIGEFALIGAWVVDHQTASFNISTSNNTLQQSGLVALCHFDNCAYSVSLYRAETCLMTMNRFSSSSVGGRHISGAWFEKCLIEYNVFDGGTAGVLLLADRTTGRGYRDNIIRRNIFIDIDEEAVGIDSQASSSTKMAVFDTGYVYATAGSAATNPTIVVSRVDQSGALNTYAGYVTQILTGSLAGRVFPVNFGGSASSFIGTATISGTSLTVTATTSGAVVIGQAVTGAGVLDGTRIVSGAGPYVLNKDQGALGAGIAVTLGSINVRFGPGGGLTTAELAATIGAQVAFVQPMDGNSVVENTFVNCVAPVSLWGYSYDTTIRGNIARLTRTSGITGRKTALSVVALAGLASSSHSVSSGAANSQCCVPSYVREYGNDWGDGEVVYSGVSYTAEATAVTGIVGQMPVFSGASLPAPTLQKWAQTGVWESSSAVPFTITQSGAFDIGTLAGWQNGEMGAYSPASRIMNSGPTLVTDQYTDTSAAPTASAGTLTTVGMRGRLAVAAGATSVIIANPNININSQMLLSIVTNDATAVIRNYVCAAGTVTLNLTATTGITSIDWSILK